MENNRTAKCFSEIIFICSMNSLNTIVIPVLHGQDLRWCSKIQSEQIETSEIPAVKAGKTSGWLGVWTYNDLCNCPDRQGESLCVDFFTRPDGTIGFEEYRRDVETLEGWFPIGFHSGKLFAELKDAKAAALKCVAWLESEM